MNLSYWRPAWWAYGSPLPCFVYCTVTYTWTWVCTIGLVLATLVPSVSSSLSCTRPRPSLGSSVKLWLCSVASRIASGSASLAAGDGLTVGLHLSLGYPFPGLFALDTNTPDVFDGIVVDLVLDLNSKTRRTKKSAARCTVFRRTGQTQWERG